MRIVLQISFVKAWGAQIEFTFDFFFVQFQAFVLWIATQEMNISMIKILNLC